MTGKRLSESGEHRKIMYRGQVKESYWNDMKLSEKYKNCTEFINKIIHEFQPIKTISIWGNQPDNTISQNDKERDFKQWIGNELKHLELRACFENSKDKRLNDIKDQFKGQL